MALIYCEECGREISDRASNCPGCGAPVAVPEAGSEQSRAQTVELTGKRWKTWQLLGVLALFVGVFLAVGGGTAHATGMEQAGIFLTILGIVTYAGSRIAAWWYHG